MSQNTFGYDIQGQLNQSHTTLSRITSSPTSTPNSKTLYPFSPSSPKVQSKDVNIPLLGYHPLKKAVDANDASHKKNTAS